MSKKTLIFVYFLHLLAFPLYIFGKKEPDFNSDEFIDEINNDPLLPLPWKARRNFPEHKTELNLILLVGSQRHIYKDFQNLPQIQYQIDGDFTKVPRQFDARTKWPHCKEIIGHIRQQSACNIFWVQVTASVISDRTCIESKGVEKFVASEEDVLSCCQNCKETIYACQGGVPQNVWQYWIERGIVTGGEYQATNNSQAGCKPDAEIFLEIPECKEYCTNPRYDVSYKEDKHFGALAYKLPPKEKQIEIEILERGPVVAAMTVYGDFFSYGSGVYKHCRGELIGSYLVKILGWGVDGQEKYWLCANNWGTDWGEMGGFFKIRKGRNHCGIEAQVRAGSLTREDHPRQLFKSRSVSESQYQYQRHLLISCIILYFVQ